MGALSDFWNFVVSGGKSGNYGAAPGSSADQLERITMANAGTEVVLPGFGPQLPAGNVGRTTDAIPGSVFDTGFATWQLQQLDDNLRYAGAAGARTTTDLGAWPFHMPDLKLQPIMDKLGQTWDSMTGSLMHPGAALDTIQNKPQAPAGRDIAVVAALGTAAAFAYLTLKRR